MGLNENKIKLVVSKKDWNSIMQATIKRTMEEHNISEDAAVLVIYNSDMYNKLNIKLVD